MQKTPQRNDAADVLDVFDISHSIAIRPSILCIHPSTSFGIRRLNERVRGQISIEISVHLGGPSVF